MRQKSGTEKAPAEQVIKAIRRVARKLYGAEEKIRIVLEGLPGEESIAALCGRGGITLYVAYMGIFDPNRTVSAACQALPCLLAILLLLGWRRERSVSTN
jgi:hypothetical protein